MESSRRGSKSTSSTSAAAAAVSQNNDGEVKNFRLIEELQSLGINVSDIRKLQGM
jgi:hypothetical protein